MKWYVLIHFLLLSPSIMAHPVIYKGGSVYWGTFMPQMNIQRLSHSFTPKLAIEAHSNRFQGVNDYQDYQLGINWLVKKWLSQNSQANIYTGFYAGYFDDAGSNGLTYQTMLMADWESRTLYTAVSVDAYFYDDDIKFRYSYRFGVAPYKAAMGELQSWLVLKLDYFDDLNSDLMITPMLRFFYNNVLWEIGSSLDGDIFLTLMVHY
ncbi:MAG: hypothetical protein R3A45_08860 [Bdellovibrionota bacterium]